MEHPDQQLESLERFFCASFDSSHRNVANASVSLWNKLFEHAGHLDYTEPLKAALSRLQPHVDMVLPGLDLSGGEYGGQEPMFFDSVDEMSLPRLPSTTSSRKGTPRPFSSRGKSPESSSRSASKPKHQKTPGTKGSDASRRRSAPRLRHHDSQLHFALIETSPLGSKQAESQVLTEHQREVRERQKENAVLFPEIRSSPGAKQKEAVLPSRSRNNSPKKLSRGREAATPEPEGAFDSYISSTPTPRRGQPVVIPEHDMPDLPSSPPEPRGNPLAAEIMSRSASNSLLEDWEFSSSPVSGSPNPSRQMPVVGPSHIDGVAFSNADEELLSASDAVAEEHVQMDADTDNELVEDTIVPEMPGFAPLQSSQAAAVPLPTTPRMQTRSKAVQETPKSDHEHFVDAPSSPLPPTPKRSGRLAKTAGASRLRVTENTQSPSPSLGGSDTEEVRSARRLVVELDRGKVKSSDYDYLRPSASPEKKAEGINAEDCIVVGDSPKKSSKKSSSLGRKASSTTLATVPATVPAAVEAQVLNSQPKPQEGRKKRKRKSSKANETGSRKRRQITPPVDEAAGPSEVPNSQPLPAATGPMSDRQGLYLTSSFEISTNASQGFEERIPSSPVNDGRAMQFDVENSQEEMEDHEQLVDLLDVKSSQFHDREAQSQIEMESRRQTEEREQEAGPAAEAMEVDNDQPGAEGEQSSQQLAPSSQNYVQKFISILRNGADLLMSAQSASSEEAWAADDALVEVTRALHEAKRRWRQ